MTAPPRRGNSRDEILQAAEWVVGEQGAGHLTLDAVAERAGISKGGLLYNFPTKEALLKAMLARLLERVDADRAEEERSGGLASAPAGPLKALVRAAFREAPDRQKVCAALLAAGANDPRLLGSVREWRDARVREFSAGGRHSTRVLMLMLALDGLWLSELLGTASYGPGVRRALMEEMLAFADATVTV
jgi:AcrR family transcriptional regulator